MSELTRKSFLGVAAAAAALAATDLAYAQPKRTAKVGPARRTLIKGADLLSMDPKTGEVFGVDVLIDNGKIAAIGKNLSASGAEVVDARGMILMPGMICGHRHIWTSLMAGKLVKSSQAYKNFDRELNLKFAYAFRPQDMYLAQYAGGLLAIDSGVTTVLDQMHATSGDEMEDAAVRGLKDSGISGYFCYQLRPKPPYGPGSTLPYAEAIANRSGPPDERHYKSAETLRDRYFRDDDLLQFGIGMTGSLGFQTPEQIAVEFKRVRGMGAKILTQHFNQVAKPRPGTVNTITGMAKAGVLGPDYHVSHGVDITDDELGIIRDAGASVCSTTLGEITYPEPSIHGRARALGVDAGIGADAAIGLPLDYFEVCRTAFWNLYKSPAGIKIASTYESSDVLDFATRLGAKALNLGDVTGTITVGKRADLVLVRTDSYRFAVAGTLADRVLTYAFQSDIDSVWISGVRRKAQGKLIGVDWAPLMRQRTEAVKHVFDTAQTITFT
jgi:cytosine/adenosine deaminase-related metal-dependent hydrolase